MAHASLRLTYAHTTSRILKACDKLGSLTLSAPEARDFVE